MMFGWATVFSAVPATTAKLAIVVVDSEIAVPVVLVLVMYTRDAA